MMYLQYTTPAHSKLTQDRFTRSVVPATTLKCFPYELRHNCSGPPATWISHSFFSLLEHARQCRDTIFPLSSRDPIMSEKLQHLHFNSKYISQQFLLGLENGNVFLTIYNYKNLFLSTYLCTMTT
jgi:hypothetical protein